MQKAMSTSKPPSRLRYEASHPTVTVRLSAEVHERLLKLRQTTGKSVADILREAVGVQEASAGSAYDRGYQAAKALYAVTWKCPVCGKDVTARAEKSKKLAGEYLAQLGGKHSECARKTGQVRKDSILGGYSVLDPSGVPIKNMIVRQRADGTTYSTQV
jgi:predicted RNA-binding Zn-ribbon protein involved in translation (DUF1610 family)